MAAKIQHIKGSDSAAGTQQTTLTNAVVAGSVVHALIYIGSLVATITSITDNKGGNTWNTLGNDKSLLVDGDRIVYAWAYIVNGGSGFQVTVVLSTGGCRLDLIESGPHPVGVAATTATSGYNAGSSTPAAASSIVTGATREFATGFYGTDRNTPGLTSIPAGWQGPQLNGTPGNDGAWRGFIWYDDVPAGTSINPGGTLAGSSEWAMLSQSFNGVALPPAAKTSLLVQRVAMIRGATR